MIRNNVGLYSQMKHDSYGEKPINGDWPFYNLKEHYIFNIDVHVDQEEDLLVQIFGLVIVIQNHNL